MTTDMLDKLLAAAEAHGKESDADHEVGDLQGVLRSCWKRLTPKQQLEVYQEHEEIVAGWLEAG